MFGPNRPAADIQGNGGFVFYLWRSQQVNRRQISLLLFLKISQLEAVEPGKQASSVLFLPEPKATWPLAWSSVVPLGVRALLLSCQDHLIRSS